MARFISREVKISRLFKLLFWMLFWIFLVLCILYYLGWLVVRYEYASKNQEIPVYNHIIKEYQIGNHKLYIPIAYGRLKGELFTDTGGYFKTYYPGGAPIIQNPVILKKQGKWYRSVMVHFKDIAQHSKFTPEKGIQAHIDLMKTTKVIGQQYGLTRQTQPDDIQNDWDDIWIESATEPNVSYITCSKPRDSVVPQCTHYFYDHNFKYDISYDRRLLPDWRIIRKNVLSMMRSFESKESAKNFITNQFKATYEEQMGEKP